jgi:transposase
MGHKIGLSTVNALLHHQKLSLQANRKTRAERPRRWSATASLSI